MLVSRYYIINACKYLLLFLLFILPWYPFAQEYRFHQYRVEQGLPNDVVKAITQDSLGFLWIATDNGLVKYDGLKFTTYKSAFTSQYIKGFLHTRDGKLLVYGDMDLIQIDNQVDTVLFHTVLKGDRNPTDSTVWFPKSAYQDHAGRIWMGEPSSILRLTGQNMKRFDLGNENRSPIFVRSFSFFEDRDQNFYAVSYQGKVFRYEPVTDQFTLMDGVQLPDEVSQVLYHVDKLVIAARNGLYTATVEQGIIDNINNAFPITAVSNLLPTADSSIIVSTYGEDLYKINFKGEFRWENLYYNFKGIKSTYISNEGDLWVATDKGVVLVQKNLFVSADINSQGQYIEAVALDKKNDFVFYCNKETLVQLQPTTEGEWERNVIFESSKNYFQSLQLNHRGLWASSSSEVFLFEDGLMRKRWDFSSEGNFVHDIYIDKDDNVWLSQGDNPYLNVITDSFIIARYYIPELAYNTVSAVRESDTGMYAAAGGEKSYLYFKKHDDSVFHNISLPLPFSVQNDFSVMDLAVGRGGIWLATTEGLLRYNDDGVRRIDPGGMLSNFSVSSIEYLDDENILFSNSHGLFRYNISSQELWLFDENSGLPSNTIIGHGIQVTENSDVWIGTSYGLAYTSRSIVASKPTRKPYCVEARVDGESRKFVKGLYADYGSYITLHFSPITFPENKINLQWRSAGDDQWHNIQHDQLNLSGLKDGKHKIEVRAKKNTGLGWSSPTVVDIIIATPFWKRVEFIMFIFALIVLIAWVSYGVSARIMSQRRGHLQTLVYERTRDLQRANEELMLRNNELDRFVYSASHDLSAPLKSILGLIRVARMDNPGELHVEYLLMMERSVMKLEEFIQEVVSYSRNARMPVKHETFQFKPFVNSLLEDHQYAQNFNKIHFIVEDRCNMPILSDLTRIKIILNNLVSNAIKFHWIDDSRYSFIRIAAAIDEKNYVITVADNGKGIEEKHLQRIFEMFYRASEEAQGSGLGLYILKESVTKLGGTVTARSAVGEGTTFTITLPVFENVPATFTQIIDTPVEMKTFSSVARS